MKNRLRNLRQQLTRSWHSLRYKGRIAATKAARRGRSFGPAPRTSAVVQFFNRSYQARTLIARLRAAGFDEIIFLEDGSSDNSLALLRELLDRPGEFILHSNDLYEVRTYDRALSFARGQFVCLLQDDDLPPGDPRWVQDALTAFDQLPDLAILGGRGAHALLPIDPCDDPLKSHFTVTDGIGSRPGVEKHRDFATPGFLTPKSDIAFEYAEAVNRAPMWLRRDPILRLGGIDQIFAPFQCDDVDLCLRAWQQGLTVALYNPGFFTGAEEGGMRIFNQGSVSNQVLKNWRLIYERYGQSIADGHFAELVRKKNATLVPVSHRPPEK